MAVGGGIANIGSPDEMDAAMAEFPLGPFTDIEVYPLTDMVGSIERMEQVMQTTASGG